VEIDQTLELQKVSVWGKGGVTNNPTPPWGSPCPRRTSGVLVLVPSRHILAGFTHF